MSLRALRKRETEAWSSTRFQRSFYETVTPNATAYQVSGCPDAYFRRFTPDGKHLIAFSRSSLSLMLFRLESGGHRRGQPHSVTKERQQAKQPAEGSPQVGTMGGHWLSTGNPMQTPQWVAQPGPSAPAPPPLQLRQQLGSGPTGSPRTPIARPQLQRDLNDYDDHGLPFTCSFSRFFSLVYDKVIVQGADRLSRDVCFVTENQRFLVLCSATPLNMEEVSEVDHETPAVGKVPKLDVIVFHLVDIKSGVVIDRLRLYNDYVHLKVEGHFGVDLHHDILVILSMRKQELLLVRVEQGGSFSQPVRIGSHCKDDDEMVLSSALDAVRNFAPEANQRSDLEKVAQVLSQTQDFVQLGPSQESPEAPNLDTGLGNGLAQEGLYQGLMQQLLAYVYRRRRRSGSDLYFFRHFRRYSDLIMLKAQLIDGDHLLIRLGRLDPAKPDWIFLVFNATEGQIVVVLDGVEAFEKLLGLYMSHIRYFWRTGNPFSRPNDFEASQAMRSLGKKEGRLGLRALNQALRGLPATVEAKSLSPYLNAEMYSYDEHKLEALDGSSFMDCSEYPAVKFILRRTGGLRFKVTPGNPGATGGLGRHKKSFRLLFHPTAPFVISMQKSALSPTAVNFHYHLA